MASLSALLGALAANASHAANGTHVFVTSMVQNASTQANASTVEAASRRAANATQLLGPSSGLGWSGYFQSVGLIFLVLALLCAALYFLKRFGSRAGFSVFGRSDLKVEGQLPLGARKNVVVVRTLNKRLVLGVTDTHITLLSELDHDTDSFEDKLDKARSSTEPD